MSFPFWQYFSNENIDKSVCQIYKVSVIFCSIILLLRRGFELTWVGWILCRFGYVFESFSKSSFMILNMFYKLVQVVYFHIMSGKISIWIYWRRRYRIAKLPFIYLSPNMYRVKSIQKICSYFDAHCTKCVTFFFHVRTIASWAEYLKKNLVNT